MATGWWWWVYPRVGGATPVNLANGTAYTWSIPAWAGQPVQVAAAVAQGEVYPRVGGATYSMLSETESLEGLSPRGRGNPSTVVSQS